MKTNQMAQKGFTLIELMIVIAIVGILAAIALPAYQDYVVRSKMSEPMAALAEAKTTVTEYYSTNNSFPTTLALAGITGFPNKDIVKSITWDAQGVIGAIVQDGIVPGSGTSYGFALSAVTKDDGSIVWRCGTEATNSAGISTWVDTKYLPSSCRIDLN